MLSTLSLGTNEYYGHTICVIPTDHDGETTICSVQADSTQMFSISMLEMSFKQRQDKNRPDTAHATLGAHAGPDASWVTTNSIHGRQRNNGTKTASEL